MNTNHEEAIILLRTMIRMPSLSREEDAVADLIFSLFEKKGWVPQRIQNNVWVQSKHWSANKPTCLLNSHIDTVRPASTYTVDPYGAIVQDDKIIGLGSNDAGASVVSLIAAFEAIHKEELPFNLILLISAEEEISGKQGVELALKHLPKIDFAIVGEPTNKKMCIAEKGLMVLDGRSIGKSGHAARDNGENAIYMAIKDIEKIRKFEFKKISPLLGKTRASVTQINAGTQHNVIPDLCSYVVDVRTNECYSNNEVAGMLADLIDGEITPRSTRLNSSNTKENHPVVYAAKTMGIELVGSPTLSDQALMPFPSIKMGPGNSMRSHTADEFIFIQEIQEGIDTYIKLLKTINT